MEIEKLTDYTKKDFNNTICLMSIIPFLAFLYLIVGKLASFAILAGEVGYVMMAILVLVLVGIALGKKNLWLLLNKLIDFNQENIKMEQELIEKNRLAAISETVLSLGHEINNPILIIRGNLELLERDLEKNEIPIPIREKLVQIKTNCERIVEVTNKIGTISKPVTTEIYGATKMLDLDKSRD